MFQAKRTPLFRVYAPFFCTKLKLYRRLAEQFCIQTILVFRAKRTLFILVFRTKRTPLFQAYAPFVRDWNYIATEQFCIQTILVFRPKRAPLFRVYAPFFCTKLKLYRRRTACSAFKLYLCFEFKVQLCSEFIHLSFVRNWNYIAAEQFCIQAIQSSEEEKKDTFVPSLCPFCTRLKLHRHRTVLRSNYTCVQCKKGTFVPNVCTFPMPAPLLNYLILYFSLPAPLLNCLIMYLSSPAPLLNYLLQQLGNFPIWQTGWNVLRSATDKNA